MPLRDHFRSPVDDFTSWESFHGGWPMVIVQQLQGRLPAGYLAGLKVHSGQEIEVDVAAFEQAGGPSSPSTAADEGGVATAVWAPPQPSVSVETDLANQDVYEVRVFDARRGRRLVAAVEIVSPANKDRPEPRAAFVTKCAALLRQGVAVSIVDLVSTMYFNLYADLLARLGHDDPTFGPEPTHLYAASSRWARREGKAYLDTWSHALAIGSPLPTLPLWLAPDLAVPLDLEASYERTCSDLRIA